VAWAAHVESRRLGGIRLSVAGREFLLSLGAGSGDRSLPIRSSAGIVWCIRRRDQKAAGRIGTCSAEPAAALRRAARDGPCVPHPNHANPVILSEIAWLTDMYV